MSDMVWFSDVMCNPDLNFYFHDPERDFSYEEEAAIFDAINQGRAADFSLLPRKMYLNNNRKFRRKNLPNAFNVWNLFLSERVFDVLREFNTGNVYYFPVDFFGHDGNLKLSETPHYGVAFTDGFETMDFEADEGHSAGANPYNPNGARSLFFGLEDGSVPILQSYNGDLDFWIDNRVRGCLFLSDRLCKALNKAGLKNAFKAKRCRIPE